MKQDIYKALLDVEAGKLSAEGALVDLVELLDIGKAPEKVKDTYIGVEMQSAPCGFYELIWKGGGSSYGAVGILEDGQRWVAPTNWTGRPEYIGTAIYDTSIEKMVRIY